MDFDLYRLKLLEGDPPSLFTGDMTREALLEKIIGEVPRTKLRKDHVWMLGNVEQTGQSAFYLRIGRVTKKSIETYSNGNFLEREFEASPYTHVFLDTALELVAVAQKSSLSPSTRTTANSLAKLLQRSEQNRDLNVDFEIDPVKDPRDFLEALASAYEVQSFSFTFNRPNPFDADRLVVKPLQETLKNTNGTKGEVTLRGKEMNSAVLQDITRSVAASGDDAVARIRPAEKQKAINKKLSGNLKRINVESVDTKDQKAAFLELVRKAYAAIRGADWEGEP